MISRFHDFTFSEFYDFEILQLQRFYDFALLRFHDFSIMSASSLQELDRPSPQCASPPRIYLSSLCLSAQLVWSASGSHPVAFFYTVFVSLFCVIKRGGTRTKRGRLPPSGGGRPRLKGEATALRGVCGEPTPPQAHRRSGAQRSRRRTQLWTPLGRVNVEVE